MRKRISNQGKPEKTVISLKKIIAIALVIMILAGMMGVMASNENAISVKIILSSGYEMNVITSTTKIEDILKENHIVVLDNETVIPDYYGELTDNKTITITKEEVQEIAQVNYLTEDEIAESYKSIVLKKVTVQEEIPFETITKDVSDGSSSTSDRVVQVGVNGIKEVTYSIKYKNGVEIERTVDSERIIKEKVDKIVEVRTKTVTSRSGVRTGSELETIWAIVMQEGGSSYDSALAVVSSAINRTNSSSWSRNGSTIYEQLTAPGQYCYSIDSYWIKYLGGNVPDSVKQAVADGMNGKTNHPYTCFRGYYVSGAEKIGGNYYFGY